ncbi:MAG TPA: response regulator [Anaerolineae bacterium]|nr:response regulator [Anaerolineae bacterium]
MNTESRNPIRALCIVREDILDIIQFFLKREGLQVITAVDGHKGLEIARVEQPDVVILDELTPGIDGFKVYTTMKGDVTLQQIPIVFLESGRVLNPPLWAANSKDILTRAPLDFKQLIATIKQMTRAQ